MLNLEVCPSTLQIIVGLQILENKIIEGCYLL